MRTLSQEGQSHVRMNRRRPILLPVHFTVKPDEEFNKQIAVLHRLLDDEAEFLTPVHIGVPIPEEADAVVLPEVLGAAYQNMPELKAISVPLLIITSEFGAVSMWDWEVAACMRAEGIGSWRPATSTSAKKMCRALGVKRQLRHSKFLVFQDNPGAGWPGQHLQAVLLVGGRVRPQDLRQVRHPDRSQELQGTRRSRPSDQ